MPAAYRSREAQTSVCEGCYVRLIREWNGQRRIGKTRPVTEFVRGKEGILHFAEDTASQIQIRR